MQDTAVVLVGGGDLSLYRAILDEGHECNVIAAGFKNKEEIKDYYRAADIFVFPTGEDIWGLVVNEAMAFGLPVITADKCVAGLELIKDGENGYLVQVENAETLKDSINSFLCENKKHKEITCKTVSTIEGYTIEAMALCHKQIFDGEINGE